LINLLIRARFRF